MTQIKHYELGELADVTKLAGFEFTKYIKYNNYGEIIALRALNLRHGELDLTDIKRIDRSVSELLPRSKLYINDILLTYTGNGYGDCAIIEENDKYHLAPNICKIAEGHLDLSRKLDMVRVRRSECTLMDIQISGLQLDIREIKNTLKIA